MKNTLITSLLCLISLTGNSQTRIDSVPPIGIHQWGDSFYRKLDVSHLQTGILIDKGCGYVDPSDHEGLSTDTPSSITSVINLYEQVYYGRVNNSYSTLALPDTVYKKWRYKTGDREATVSMIYAPFEKIKEQGTNDTPFFKEILGQLIDNRSRVDSPYIADTLFSAAIQHQEFIVGKIKFLFPSNLQFLLGLSSFTLEAHFGTGNTWHNIVMDSSYDVTYNDSGFYTVQIRVTPNGGRVFKASFQIKIKYGIWLLNKLDPTLAFLNFTWVDQYAPDVKAYVYPTNSSATCLSKPYIFIEGFDPLEDRGQDQLHDIINEFDETNPQNYFRQLQSAGYDVVIVDFGHSGGESIPLNAQSVVRLIQYINSIKCGSDQLVVSGFSMGGLVARYALAYMEQSCIPHNTRLYISMDSPHQGANTPMGLQALSEALYKHFGIIPKLQDAHDANFSPAAKEMTVAHISAGGSACTERGVFTSLYEGLGMPQTCRNIAFSLGNTFLQQSTFNVDPSSPLKDMQEENVNSVPYILGNEILNWEAIKNTFVEVSVFAVNTSNAPYIHCHVWTKHKIKGKTKIDDIAHFEIWDDFPYEYDTRAGSVMTTHYDLAKQLKKNPVGDVETHSRNHHTMIHTNSAFHLKTTNQLLSMNTSTIINSRIYTDFDNLGNIDNTYSYRHMRIQPSMRVFLLNEVFASTPPTNNRYLFGTLSTIYNFTGAMLAKQNLNSVIITSGGILKINADEDMEYAGYGGDPIAGTNPNVYSRNCSQITIESGGRMEIGDDNSSSNGNNKAQTYLTNGSVLEIKSGGVLKIYNGSRLIIDDGATLVFNPGATIYLEGNNAILEIRGGLIVKNGATFTFTTENLAIQNGFLRIKKTGTSGTKYIFAQGTASFNLDGQGCTDKLLEIDNCNLVFEDNYEFPTHYFSHVSITDGHILYVGDGAALTTGSQGTWEDLHLEGATGSAMTTGLFTKGQTFSTPLTRIKFKGLTTGLSADQDIFGGNIELVECRFINGVTGLYVVGNKFDLSECAFENQTGYGIICDVEANCTMTEVRAYGNLSTTTDVGVSFGGSNNSTLTISECSFIYYGTGIELLNSGISLIGTNCSYFTLNEKGVYAAPGSRIDLSKAIGYSGGDCYFYNNTKAIVIDDAQLYVNLGDNFFISTLTNPMLVEGTVSTTQTDQINLPTLPSQATFDTYDNYWSPSPSNALPSYINVQRSIGGGQFRSVGIAYSSTMPAYSDPCYDFEMSQDVCGTASKTIKVLKIPMPDQKSLLSQVNALQEKLNMYPNPSAGTLNIICENAGIKKVSIYDFTGKVLFTQEFAGLQNISFDLSHFATGIYYVEVNTINGIRREKLSLIHN